MNLNNYDLWNGRTKSKRETIFSKYKDEVLTKQKNKCAGKNCAKNHGKRLPVNNRSHFDHKKPVALNGKTIASNLQALCANCHQEKTREDRMKIALTKKKKDNDPNILGLGGYKPPKLWIL